MSSTLQPNYGTLTTLLSALASLTNTSAYQTNAVDNTSNLFMQVKFQVQFTSPGSGLSGNSVVNVYVASSRDGSTWPGEGSGNSDGVTGTAGGIALEAPCNLTKVASIAVPTASKTYTSDWIELTIPYMGVVPAHWAIIVENQVGGTITSVSVFYHGVALVGS